MTVSAATLALLDRLPEAREQAERGMEVAREHSIIREAASYQILSVVLIRADLETARRKLEWSDGVLEKMGETGARSSSVAMLADVAQMMGDLDRADAAVTTAKQIAVEDDIDALARALAAECKILALRADDRAFDAGRRALQISEATEYLLMRARVLTLVAEAHELLGDAQTAADLHRRALAISEEKGDVWSAKLSKAALMLLGSSSEPTVT